VTVTDSATQRVYTTNQPTNQPNKQTEQTLEVQHCQYHRPSLNTNLNKLYQLLIL